MRRGKGDMLFNDIPLVGMLKQRMNWHQERQSVLAQNVANADTPNYLAKDLKAPEFGPMAEAARGVQLAATNPMHFAPRYEAGNEAGKAKTYEITPEGNAVVLEEEVMRVSQNVIDYQMVSQLYSRGLGVLKTAIGRRA
jgi:flagellar basal-body rod protein FlgB